MIGTPKVPCCKAHGIRISEPALGRPKQQTLIEKKQAYTDHTDRIEVERGFNLVTRFFYGAVEP